MVVQRPVSGVHTHIENARFPLSDGELHLVERPHGKAGVKLGIVVRAPIVPDTPDVLGHHDVVPRFSGTTGDPEFHQPVDVAFVPVIDLANIIGVDH